MHESVVDASCANPVMPPVSAALAVESGTIDDLRPEHVKNVSNDDPITVLGKIRRHGFTLKSTSFRPATEGGLLEKVHPGAKAGQRQPPCLS